LLILFVSLLAAMIKLYEYNLGLELFGSISYIEYASVSKTTLMEGAARSVAIKQQQSEWLNM